MRFHKLVRLFVLSVGCIFFLIVSLDAQSIRVPWNWKFMEGRIFGIDDYSIVPFYLDIKDSSDAYLGTYYTDGGDGSIEIIIKKQKGKIVVSRVLKAAGMKPEIIYYHNCLIRNCVLFTDEDVFVFVKEGQLSHSILQLCNDGASEYYKKTWLSPTGKAYQLVSEVYNNLSQAYSAAKKLSGYTEADKDVNFGIGKFVILPKYSEGYQVDGGIEFDQNLEMTNCHLEGFYLKYLTLVK